MKADCFSAHNRLFLDVAPAIPDSVFDTSRVSGNHQKSTFSISSEQLTGDSLQHLCWFPNEKQELAE